jgi:hypothetical protein
MPGRIIGRASVQSFLMAFSSASLNARLRSMKSICDGSTGDRGLPRFSISTATRLAASSAPSTATEFDTSRGMSRSHRRITSTPSSFKWS